MRSVDFNHIDDIAILRAMLIEQQAHLIDRNAQLNDRNAQLNDRNVQLSERDALIAAHERTISRKTSEIDYKTAKIAKLTAEIARLKRLQFSAHSEQFNPEQRALFDETMAADIAAVEAQLEALRDPSSMNKPRSPAVRRPLPPELPRVETVHKPEGCACGRCVGELVKIGEHVRETLDCKPTSFFVRRDVYPQYACRACETVVAEAVAPAILDRSLAAPGFIAHVIVSKYVDHLPLYRQEAIDARSGVEIGRQTRAELIGAAGMRLQPLVDAMGVHLRGCAVLHADETPVAQLDPGAGKTKQAYLFAYCTASEASPIMIFDYCQSRSGKHASAFLDGWQGALMVDGYPGYKALFKDGIIELGCWAHARRKFFELHKANKSEIAAEALQRIAMLYVIEQQAREMSAADRYAHRQRNSKPLIDALFDWLIRLRPTIVGNSGSANAIDYTLKRAAALSRYLDDGRYPIDNNAIENAIRPIALGRKNWLFTGSEVAGQRAAAIMSLLATAKANGHCPHAWLTDVLTRLPTTLDKHIGELLPHRWRTAASM
jgi:transposase